MPYITSRLYVMTFDKGCVSPKLSQLGRQLTERQLDYKLNASFRFTNVRHVNSNLSQLKDDQSVTRVLIG